jgi:hypothetical protein
MGGGVALDGGDALVRGGMVGQAALQQLEAAGHRMHVRVLEPGRDQPARDVDPLRSRAGGLDRVGRVAHGDDPPASYRDRGGPGSDPVTREDGTTGEHDGTVGCSHRILPPHSATTITVTPPAPG